MTADERETPAIWRDLGIRASAGSGKTYELALQFIARLASGAGPSQIVATTFTRKAAGEILNRILARLAQAAASEEARSKLLAEIEQVGHNGAIHGPQRTLHPNDAVRLLRLACSCLHRMQVSTIDALFLTLTGAFALEMGLADVPQMVDEASQTVADLRTRALQSALDELLESPSLAILDALTDSRAVRSVADRLFAAISNLRDVYLETSPAAWSALSVPSCPVDDIDEALASLERLCDTTEDKRVAKAIRKAVQQARLRDWKGFVGQGPGQKVLEGSNEYYRRPITEALRAALLPLLGVASHELLSRNRERTSAMRTLLERFVPQYARLLRDSGLLTFADLPRILSHHIHSFGDAEVAYRLDVTPEHLLLDEFQDTNHAQWRVLRALAGIGDRTDRPTTGPSTRHAAILCVGDTKQAIYGWRGGCAAILDTLGDALPEMAWQYRSKSYRSSPVVLGWVDKVFTSLTSCPEVSQYADVVDHWQSVYKPHQAAQDLAGYAELLVSPEETPEATDAVEQPDGQEPPASDQYVRWAAERIGEIAHLHPTATIGVLTRTNPRAAHVSLLLQAIGIHASLEGPGAIADDPAVELILSALRLADHPGSTVEAHHVFHSPLRSVLKLTANDAHDRLMVSLALRRSLAERGYGDLVATYGRALAPYGDARTAHRLTQLVEAADEYDRSAGIRPQDFVESVRALTVNERVPAGVRVMTIHQSKGLEFDVVVLPELEKRIFAGSPAVVTVRRDPDGPIEEVHAYPDKLTQSFSEQLRDAVAARSAQEFAEALNVLYVAMTRARHALHMLLPRPKLNKDGSIRKEQLSMSTLVVHALCPDGLKGVTRIETGVQEWDIRRTEPALPPDERAAMRFPRPVTFAKTAPQRLWPEAAPSSPAAQAPDNLADLLRLDTAPLDQGAIIHAWLQAIEWLGEHEPDDAALLWIGQQTAPRRPPDWIEALLPRFRAMLRQPVTRAALTRSSECIELWRERAYVLGISGSLVRGRIDRLEINRDPAGLRYAVITDFKTDSVPPDAVPRRAEQYRPQMAAYVEAVSAALNLPFSRVRARLLFVVPDVLEPMPVTSSA